MPKHAAEPATSGVLEPEQPQVAEALASFAELYAHFDYVWSVVRRMGVPDEAAEDATQDVFIVVHRRMRDSLPCVSYKAWLFGVAVRVAKDYRRRAARKGHHVTLELASNLQSPRWDPYEGALCQEMMERVQTFLNELDKDRRAVFVLAEFGEMSGPEIASELQVKLNTAYTRLRLARQQFARLVEELDASSRSSERSGDLTSDGTP